MKQPIRPLTNFVDTQYTQSLAQTKIKNAYFVKGYTKNTLNNVQYYIQNKFY